MEFRRLFWGAAGRNLENPQKSNFYPGFDWKTCWFAVKMREDGTILYQSMLQFFCEIQLVITLDPYKIPAALGMYQTLLNQCEKPIEKTIQSVPQWCRILSMKSCWRLKFDFDAIGETGFSQVSLVVMVGNPRPFWDRQVSMLSVFFFLSCFVSQDFGEWFVCIGFGLVFFGIICVKCIQYRWKIKTFLARPVENTLSRMPNTWNKEVPEAGDAGRTLAANRPIASKFTFREQGLNHEGFIAAETKQKLHRPVVKGLLFTKHFRYLKWRYTPI